MEQIEFRNIADITIPELTAVFNEAFSDYLIRVQLTEAQMERKIQQEHISLSWSVGVYQQSHLVGFLLHGVRQHHGKTYCYNAGTGVVPAHRGKGYNAAMYAWWRQYVAAMVPNKVTLEVIAGNEKAVHIYSSISFRRQRTFNIWQGKTPENICKKPIQIQ